ncbi:MAG: transposase [Clostridiaceae bacterium]|nr:transposase [Clostridiaceae bacterium]
MGTNYEKIFYKDYEQLYQQKEKIAGELCKLQYYYNLLESKYETSEKAIQELAEQNALKDAQIAELTKSVQRLESLLNIDGTNSGTPTSATPINKKKVVPNSREKTGEKIGGQPGHPKKKLERFADSEVGINVEHALDECPNCHCTELEDTDEVIEKDCLDYKVVVTKTRHKFRVHRCHQCGKEVHETIPTHLKEENQYGVQVQAMALMLMNQGNVPINKVRKMTYGFTEGEIQLSEGYICKLQERASRKAWDFCEEVRREILKRDIVHWDDTVIMVDTKRACLRFYGTKDLALYKAHMHKDKEGLDNDNILNLLPPTTTVSHDHNVINYNKNYSYANAECNAHLIRDLQRVQDNLGHKWAEDLAKLLTETNKRREELIENGVSEFSPAELSTFFNKFNDIMIHAYAENGEASSKYYADKERTLMLRILDFKNEYLAWVVNFSIPFTNNLSERSLRGAKVKMKVSGQYQNIKTARFYANIKSYIETCYRNGINEFYALLRLCRGDPFTLEEILHPPNPSE